MKPRSTAAEAAPQLVLPILATNEESTHGSKATAPQRPTVTRLATPLCATPCPVGSHENLRSQLCDCQCCGLRGGATQVVPGEGDVHARLMLVGEGPGEREDQTGRPFVGAAGQLLDKILAAIGLSRDDVFIANIVKCRPPGNRVPTDDEARACLPYLLRQIELVSPSVVVCLGSTSLRALIGQDLRITRNRGQWFERNSILYIGTYHPAALLRDPSKKRDVWEDFKLVRDMLGLGAGK